MTPEKRRRNVVFRACGWIIVASMALVLVSNALDLDLLFWLESFAVTAIGISWLVKGGAFPSLRDQARSTPPPSADSV